MIDDVYISRPFSLLPSEAVRTTDSWHHALEPVGVAVRRLSAAHHLWIKRDLERGGCDPHQLRRALGTLWVTGIPVPVELELLIWSHNATELAIRPLRLGWPVQTERYARLARRVLNEAVDVLIALSKGMDPETAEASTPARGFLGNAFALALDGFQASAHG